MTVESSTYISQLNSSYPAAGDPKSEGDDHIRKIKANLQATFPNLTAAAVTPSTTELNYVTGVTSAIQTQLNTKAPLASPALTGTPTAPTATALTNSTQIATTAYTDAAVTALAATKADLASPALTGTPTAPTATAGTSSTQIATTAFVAATAFSSALPAQAGNAGKFVTTDGTTASWAEGLPTQATHANKVLTTNGTSSSWTADWPGNTLPVAKGGTGLATLTANGMLMGNGTSAIQALSPGASGNVVTSNGTTWTSAANTIDGNLVLVSTVTASGGTSVAFSAAMTSTYDMYVVQANRVTSGGSANVVVTLTATGASMTAVGSTSLVNPGTSHTFEALVYIVDSDNKAGVILKGSSTSGVSGEAASSWSRSSGTAGRVDGISFTIGGSAITGTFKLYGVKKA